MDNRWNKLSMSEKSQLMGIYASKGYTDLASIIAHYNSFATGGALPDHDPSNPYHYHNAQGEKVVITPEDWEANVGKPYFKEIEAAVRAEQAAHPAPEYEVNPNFVRDLRSTYAGNMGYGYQNYKNFQHNLPQGYSFTPEGVIIGPDGTAYVQSGYRQSPRFTYSTDNPLQFTINQGKPIERNLTFYPVNMDRRVKAPLPVDRTLDVSSEREKAISSYLENNRRNVVNKTHTYNIGFQPSSDSAEVDTSNNPIPYLYALGYPNKMIIPLRKRDEDIINKYYNNIKQNKKFVRYVGRYPDITKEQSLELLKQLDLNNIIDVEEFKLPSKYDIMTNTTKKPSRKEAEKKAVIEIGPLQQLGTFATGGLMNTDGPDEPEDNKIYIAHPLREVQIIGQRNPSPAEILQQHLDNVNSFYYNDVVPRLQREHQGLKTKPDINFPYVNPEDIDFNPLSLGRGKAAAYVNPIFPQTIHSYYKPGEGRDFGELMTHENSHRWQFEYPKRDKQYQTESKEILRQAYGNFNDKYREVYKELPAFIKYGSKRKLVNSEYEADNRAARYNIWRDYIDLYHKTPTVEELDRYIDEIPALELYKKYIVPSGYLDIYYKPPTKENKQYRDFYDSKMESFEENIQKVREALKHVAQNNSSSQDTSHYAALGGLLY